MITYTAEDGNPDTANVTSTAAGNILTTGADGGSFLNQTTVAANETDTSLAQNTTTGVITYTAEDGNPDTANVVSTDANNALSVGGDGGAFINTSSLGTDDQNLSVTSGTATTSVIAIENGTDVTLAAGAGVTLTENTGTGTITIIYDSIFHDTIFVKWWFQFFCFL